MLLLLPARPGEVTRAPATESDQFVGSGAGQDSMTERSPAVQVDGNMTADADPSRRRPFQIREPIGGEHFVDQPEALQPAADLGADCHRKKPIRIQPPGAAQSG
jgi:hypothetical protein